MFACCATKPKKEKTQTPEPRTQPPSDTHSLKNSNKEETINKKSDETINQSTQQTFPQIDQEMNKVVREIMEFKKHNQYDKSRKTESDYITGLINDENMPTPYILDFKWAVQYTQYLKGSLKTFSQPIDNSRLLRRPTTSAEKLVLTDLKKNNVLVSGLKSEKDFVLLNQAAWKFIQTMYGGGPEIYYQIEPEKTNVDQDSQNNKKLQNMSRTVEIRKDKENINKAPTQQSDEPIYPRSQISSPQQSRFAQSQNKNQQFSAIQPQDQQRQGQFQKSTTIKSMSELPIVGLQNPRFYCYMNAALQCLLSVQGLNDQMLNVKGGRHINAYQEFLRKIIASKARRDYPIIAAQSIWSISQGKFQFHQQQDSHEFLLYLMQQMQEELVVKYKNKQEFQSAIQAWNDYTSKNKDPIDEIFAGQITSQSLCKSCKEVCEGYDPFWDISIPFASSMFGCDLVDCLKQHFKEETINDIWTCDKCKRKNKSVKRKIQISQLPKILILQLKRFSPHSQKLTNNIKFRESLDISDYCVPQIQKNGRYQLKCCVVHLGQINGGHYFAYTKRDNNWYCFDDENVTRVPIDKVLSENQAYVFFYEQV